MLGRWPLPRGWLRRGLAEAELFQALVVPPNVLQALPLIRGERGGAFTVYVGAKARSARASARSALALAPRAVESVGVGEPLEVVGALGLKRHARALGGRLPERAESARRSLRPALRQPRAALLLRLRVRLGLGGGRRRWEGRLGLSAALAVVGKRERPAEPRLPGRPAP